MDNIFILGISLAIAFWGYSSMLVYKSLYTKVQEENSIVDEAKAKLDNKMKKNILRYEACVKERDTLNKELKNSIIDTKSKTSTINALKKEKINLEEKISQLYETIGNA